MRTFYQGISLRMVWSSVNTPNTLRLIEVHHRSVNQIAQVKPKNKEALLEISGIGPGKVKKYATLILELVNQ